MSGPIITVKSSSTITEDFQEYVRDNWKNNPSPDFKGLAIRIAGAAGETGEWLEHMKKVIRNYNGDFNAYPKTKRDEARLEFGDALHYMVRCMQDFGFTLEEVMIFNIEKITTCNQENPNWDKTP